MRRRAIATAAALLIGGALVYVGVGAATQGVDNNPVTIRRLLFKFDEAQATAPFRYPTACVAGTAEEYTQMALSAGLHGARGVQLDLWTVPEAFSRVADPEPDRKSGRCDYRATIPGATGSTHFVSEFFSRKEPRTGEIARVKVWQQGRDQAVLVSFPNGARGMNPDIRFKVIPVNTKAGAKP